MWAISCGLHVRRKDLGGAGGGHLCSHKKTTKRVGIVVRWGIRVAARDAPMTAPSDFPSRVFITSARPTSCPPRRATPTFYSAVPHSKPL